MTNKYLEKIASFLERLEKQATVPGAVKAQRRLAQLLATKTHDFHMTGVEGVKGVLSSKVLHPSPNGTMGPGVYAGRGAPAHEYQRIMYHPKAPQFRSMIAYKGDPNLAVPHGENERLHYRPFKVQDSLSRKSVPMSEPYVVLPGSAKKHKGWASEVRKDLEPDIRQHRARRLYSDDLDHQLPTKGYSSRTFDQNGGVGDGVEDFFGHKAPDHPVYKKSPPPTRFTPTLSTAKQGYKNNPHLSPPKKEEPQKTKGGLLNRVSGLMGKFFK